MRETDNLKKSFIAFLHCSEKKITKMSFGLDGHFREGSLNFNFSASSIKSSYDDIFFFPNKLKFDNSNICSKLLIMQQEIIINCPSDKLISLKSNI